jgi:hypothetical protein
MGPGRRSTWGLGGGAHGAWEEELMGPGRRKPSPKLNCAAADRECIFFCVFIPHFFFFLFFIIILLYGGYTVTFTKVLTICVSKIHPFHHLLYLLPPFLEQFQQVSFFHLLM